jgi:hypothetical protein
MFLWKNAVVLCALLGIIAFPAGMLVRARWEKRYIARIVICGMLVCCFAVSALPMLWTQLIFCLLLIACFDKRVPMAATYLFFFFWTPAAGSLLGVAGAYIAPLTPFMSFSAALVVGFLIYPENHLRRPLVMSDVWMLLFVLLYCTCASLRAAPTGVARNIATYFVPYVLSYALLSRVRIERPELVLRLMLFGAAAAAMLCMFETVRRWPLYAGIWGVKNDLWTIDSPRAWLERGGVARAYGPFAHPLTGSAMLGLAAVAGWGLWLIRGRSGPLFALGLALLCGLACTLSRSGLVALVIGLMVFQMLRGRFLFAVFALLGGLAILTMLPILSGDDARLSGLYRLGLVTGIPRALGAHVWLGYREAVQQGLLDKFVQGQGIVDLVDAYIGIIVEGGIVSLIPFLLFLLSTFPHYRAIRRLSPDRDQLVLAQVLVAIQAALIPALALLGSWVAPMQLAFLANAILVALRFNLVRVRASETPKPAPLVATMPVNEGERLPALR